MVHGEIARSFSFCLLRESFWDMYKMFICWPVKWGSIPVVIHHMSWSIPLCPYVKIGMPVMSVSVWVYYGNKSITNVTRSDVHEPLAEWYDNSKDKYPGAALRQWWGVGNFPTFSPLLLIWVKENTFITLGVYRFEQNIIIFHIAYFNLKGR